MKLQKMSFVADLQPTECRHWPSPSGVTAPCRSADVANEARCVTGRPVARCLLTSSSILTESGLGGGGGGAGAVMSPRATPRGPFVP
jgi:hypothetical protein